MESEFLWPVAGWPLPVEVRVERDALAYRLGEGGRRVRPEPAQLRGFVALARAPEGGLAERVSGHVWKYGPLGLCPSHRLPRGHPARFIGRGPARLTTRVRDGQPLPYDPAIKYELSECRWPDDPEAWVREPLAEWRRYAAGARAVQLLWGSSHHRDSPGGRVHDPGLWRALLDARVVVARSLFVPRNPVPPSAEVVPELRRTVNDWLLAANMPLVLDPATGGFIYLATTLFGGLTMQLALMLSRGEVPLPCSELGCANLAVPRRRGAPAFCEEHSNEAATNRARQRRFRGSNPDYYTKAAKAERAARGAGKRSISTDGHESI